MSTSFAPSLAPPFQVPNSHYGPTLCGYPTGASRLFIAPTKPPKPFKVCQVVGPSVRALVTPTLPNGT